MATDLLTSDPALEMAGVDLSPAPNRVFYSGGPSSEYFPQASRNDLFIAIAICAVFVLTGFNRLNHTDLWGHLNFGRWIVENRQLPTSDPFGAVTSEKAFVNVPWLAQVLGYATWAVGGVDGLQLAHASLVAVGFAILFLALFARGVDTRWAIAAVAAAYVLGLPIWGTIRPQLFGVIGFPLALWAISELNDKKHPLYWLGPAFALWANLHGSFAMGLAAIGLAVAAAAWDAYRAENNPAAIFQDDRFRRFALALGIAVAGCCLNPIGVWIFPAVADFGKGDAMKSISEWRSLDLRSLTGALFVVSIGLTWVVSQRSTRSWTAQDLLMLVFFGLLCITAMRMIQWWAMVWPWVLAPHAQSAWESLFAVEASATPEENPSEEKVELAESESDEPVTLPSEPTTVGTLLVLAVVFVALLLAPASNALISGNPRGLVQVVSDDTPIYLGEEFARRGFTGTFAAPIDWADYVVWESQGKAKPLAYSHVHLLDDKTWHDEQQIIAGASDWLERADERGVKYLVVSRNRHKELIKAALKSPRIQVSYQDQQGMVLRIGKIKPKAKLEEPKAAAPKV